MTHVIKTCSCCGDEDEFILGNYSDTLRMAEWWHVDNQEYCPQCVEKKELLFRSMAITQPEYKYYSRMHHLLCNDVNNNDSKQGIPGNRLITQGNILERNIFNQRN